jgi:two-component system, LytTR family, response regulator
MPNAPVVSLRVLVVEDEPPARRRLRSLLQQHADVTIVGEAAHGGEAVDLIQRERPDVVLLDVELPVANGFEVIDAVGASSMPDVIFVTAYDHYAIRAFEVHALDYLLKPVDHERLSIALERARMRLTPRRPGATLGRAMDDIRQLPALRRIPVRHADRIVFVEISDIDYVLAEGNYVRVRARGATYLIRETLNAFEAKLRPHGFLRIQRGTLVQRDRIAELQPLFHGEYVVRLKDGTKLTSGRSYRDQMRAALQLKGDDWT